MNKNPSEWGVKAHRFGGTQCFVVSRLRDKDAGDTFENIETKGPYFLKEQDAINLAEKLNNEEAFDED